MTNQIRAYANASNAKRAAQQAVQKTNPDTIFATGIKTYRMVTEEGAPGYYAEIFFDNIDTDLTEEDHNCLKFFKLTFEPSQAPDETKSVKEKKPRTPTIPKAGHINKSSVKGPVKRVHTICTEMFKANPATQRKEVIARCVSEGIATHTAATQYARWKKAN